MKISIPPAWRTRIHRYRLVATECKDCGRAFYPPSQICRYCGSRNTEEKELVNEKARLITWTVIYSAMEGFEDRRPLVLGILETVDSKVKILAPLTDVLSGELRIGMIMEPVLRRVKEDCESGLVYYGVSFRPVIK